MLFSIRMLVVDIELLRIFGRLPLDWMTVWLIRLLYTANRNIIQFELVSKIKNCIQNVYIQLWENLIRTYADKKTGRSSFTWTAFVHNGQAGRFWRTLVIHAVQNKWPQGVVDIFWLSRPSKQIEHSNRRRLAKLFFWPTFGTLPSGLSDFISIFNVIEFLLTNPFSGFNISSHDITFPKYKFWGHWTFSDLDFSIGFTPSFDDINLTVIVTWHDTICKSSFTSITIHTRFTIRCKHNCRLYKIIRWIL